MTQGDGAATGTSSAFDEDTWVEPVRDGLWRAEVTDRWDVIGGAPNGGYLTAILLNALGAAAGRPHALTSTAHFVAPAEHGPADVRTEIVRRGRHTTGTARLERDGRPLVLVTATFGDLDDAVGPTLLDLAPPALPPIEQCLAPPEGADLPPIAERVEMRLDPACVGWAVGRPSGDGYIGGYMRLADGREADAAALPLLADALPPAALNLADSVAWVPTLELTVHVRAVPAPGWLRGVFRTRALVDGYLEEDGEIWDAEGRLVALSRQLALLRTR